VVSRVDEGLVLLQGALTPMSMVGGATVHALRSHMSPLNFCLKSSVLDFAQDLSAMLLFGPLRILDVEMLWSSS
jgi:hypothetical protein